MLLGDQFITATDNFREEVNLEDRSVLFLMFLICYLATQAGIFYKLLYNVFFKVEEKISDVINSEWDISEYISRKFSAFSWVTSVVGRACPNM